MRKRIPHRADNRVGFAELFFDLVFVFAITQISQTLFQNYSLQGAAETGFLLVTIWGVWIYSTWVLNQFDPETLAVRALLFALMVGGLFLAMAVPEAFHARGPVFALAFVSMQVGRTAFAWWASHEKPETRRNFLRVLIWFLISGALWLAGGLVHGTLRWGFWLCALGLDLGVPMIDFALPGLGRTRTTDWVVRGGHIAERCGLFVIICLGESLLIAGATFSHMQWTAAGMVTFLSSVSVAIGMWWVYFHIGYQRGTDQIEHSDAPGRPATIRIWI